MLHKVNPSLPTEPISSGTDGHRRLDESAPDKVVCYYTDSVRQTATFLYVDA